MSGKGVTEDSSAWLSRKTLPSRPAITPDLAEMIGWADAVTTTNASIAMPRTANRIGLINTSLTYSLRFCCVNVNKNRGIFRATKRNLTKWDRPPGRSMTGRQRVLPYDVGGGEGADVSHRRHVGELRRGSFPSAGLAPHHRDRRNTLHGEGEEDQQGHGAAGRQVVVQRGLQSMLARLRIHSVDGPQRGDDGLARGHRGNQPDPDLPVETERLDDR